MDKQEIIQLANRIVSEVIQWILVEGCDNDEVIDLAYETINTVDAVAAAIAET